MTESSACKPPLEGNAALLPEGFEVSEEVANKAAEAARAALDEVYSELKGMKGIDLRMAVAARKRGGAILGGNQDSEKAA